LTPEELKAEDDANYARAAAEDEVAAANAMEDKARRSQLTPEELKAEDDANYARDAADEYLARAEAYATLMRTELGVARSNPMYRAWAEAKIRAAEEAVRVAWAAAAAAGVSAEALERRLKREELASLCGDQRNLVACVEAIKRQKSEAMSATAAEIKKISDSKIFESLPILMKNYETKLIEYYQPTISKLEKIQTDNSDIIFAVKKSLFLLEEIRRSISVEKDKMIEWMRGIMMRADPTTTEEHKEVIDDFFAEGGTNSKSKSNSKSNNDIDAKIINLIFDNIDLKDVPYLTPYVPLSQTMEQSPSIAKSIEPSNLYSEHLKRVREYYINRYKSKSPNRKSYTHKSKSQNRKSYTHKSKSRNRKSYTHKSSKNFIIQ
jgi:hypothetical protein